jgi:hypothetical protein
MHPLLVEYETRNQCEMVNKIQVMLIAICFILFGDRMKILFIIKVNILLCIEWLYRSSQSF